MLPVAEEFHKAAESQCQTACAAARKGILSPAQPRERRAVRHYFCARGGTQRFVQETGVVVVRMGEEHVGNGARINPSAPQPLQKARKRARIPGIDQHIAAIDWIKVVVDDPAAGIDDFHYGASSFAVCLHSHPKQKRPPRKTRGGRRGMRGLFRAYSAASTVKVGTKPRSTMRS